MPFATPSLGGDSDTLACITGDVVEAFYDGVPAEIVARVEQVLPLDLWEVMQAFRRRYP
jgi:ADP-ribosylglycohydrolase